MAKFAKQISQRVQVLYEGAHPRQLSKVACQLVPSDSKNVDNQAVLSSTDVHNFMWKKKFKENETTKKYGQEYAWLLQQ